MLLFHIELLGVFLFVRYLVELVEGEARCVGGFEFTDSFSQSLITYVNSLHNLRGCSFEPMHP